MTLNEIRNHVPEQVEKDHSKHPFGEYGLNGKHMYHEKLDPVVVYNAADEKAARAKGYGTEYIWRKK